MEKSRVTGQHSSPPKEFGRLPECFAASIRFWEPRRLVYNLVLAAFVVAWLAGTWPHFRPAINLIGAFQLGIFGLLANLCYSTAYIGEVLVRPSAPTTSSFPWRSALWVLGTVLAVLFENYWIADEIYPFVR
jgi:hypothetical protein